MLKLLTCCVIICMLQSSFANEDDASEDFFEVDVRKFESERAVGFGAHIYSDHWNKYPTLIEMLGPSFKLAYWRNIWEVSPAAPPPHNSDDDRMGRWLETIYYNMAPEVEVMQNTSRLMVDKKIQVVFAADSPPNAYYNTPKKIRQFRERMKAAEEGRVIEEEEWSFEKEMEEKAKEDPNEQYLQFMPESTADFAKFWAFSVERQQNLNLTLPLLELTLEPDSKDSVYFYPEDYAKSVKLTRQEIRRKEIPDDKNKIIGPGSSSPTAAKPYIEALVNDREAYDALYAWSIHIWDKGLSMEEIEREIQGFRQIVQATVPSSWPKKPTIVSQFGYKPASDDTLDEVKFNGNMKYCYKKIMGRWQTSEDDLENTMAQSPPIGVRLLASLFLQYSLGLDQAIYEELRDTPWSFSCSGIFDRQNRKKQIYVAFSTFLSYLDTDSVVVRKQWKNTNECYTVMLKSSARLVVAVANPSASSCSRSFSLSGVDIPRIGQAFSVSYNNGTVSLAATDPSEALVLKRSLEYDVYSAEAENESDLVEFDIALRAHASTTVVFNFTQKNETADSLEVLIEEPFDPKTAHSEL